MSDFDICLFIYVFKIGQLFVRHMKSKILSSLKFIFVKRKSIFNNFVVFMFLEITSLNPGDKLRLLDLLVD